MKQTICVDVDTVKWFITYVCGGYVVLVGAIGYLTKELLKAKDEESDLLREILPLSTKLTDVCQSVTTTINALLLKEKD